MFTPFKHIEAFNSHASDAKKNILTNETYENGNRKKNEKTNIRRQRQQIEKKMLSIIAI